jgi:hypothetical protein
MTAPGDDPGLPRPFVLQRHVDVSGVSGTGQVAEGVQWSDGTVSLRWSGERPSITFWQGGVADLEAVHGHSGGTEVRFVEPEPATTTMPTSSRLRGGCR